VTYNHSVSLAIQTVTAESFYCSSATRNALYFVYFQASLYLSRYNDFKNDPQSACNCTPPYSGENAIAARSDLNPPNGTYSVPVFGFRDHGATDVKVTSSSMVR